MIKERTNYSYVSIYWQSAFLYDYELNMSTMQYNFIRYINFQSTHVTNQDKKIRLVVTTY